MWNVWGPKAARLSGSKGLSAWQLYVAGLQERRAICGALSREVARMHRAAMTSQPRAQDAAAPKQWQAWDQAFAQVGSPARQLCWHKCPSRQRFAWQQP